MSLVIPVLPFGQKGRKMYMGILSLEQLDRLEVDVWRPNKAPKYNGYQRAAVEARAKKITRYLQRRDAIMPAAGLLNVRKGGNLVLRDGNLIIPDETRVWVVDMQHRLLGLKHAFDKKVIGNDFKFPVVITEGLSREEEAAQFYIINTKAKRMDISLTQRLLIANNFVKDIEEAKKWVIPSVQTAIRLNSEIPGNPWYDQLRQPNDPAKYIANEKSFVNSLRAVYGGGKSRPVVATARKLATFWNGVRAAIPDAFPRELRDKKRYIIQKTAGIYAFNFTIFPVFLQMKFSESSYARRLKKLSTLGKGADFWRGKNRRGAAGYGTGEFAYQRLAQDILRKLNIRI